MREKRKYIWNTMCVPDNIGVWVLAHDFRLERAVWMGLLLLVIQLGQFLSSGKLFFYLFTFFFFFFFFWKERGRGRAQPLRPIRPHWVSTMPQENQAGAHAHLHLQPIQSGPTLHLYFVIMSFSWLLLKKKWKRYDIYDMVITAMIVKTIITIIIIIFSHDSINNNNINKHNQQNEHNNSNN